MNILPHRRIDWQHAGIQGGIPRDYAQIGATVAATGDATDRAPAIQAALDAAPPKSVVRLGAGRFNISATLQIRNGVLLRGSGPTQTTIVGDRTLVSFYEYQARDEPVMLATGASKGATSIQLSGAPGSLGVGMVMQIQEENDARIVTGIEGDSGPYAMGQWVKIKGISGSVYDLDTPLYTEYKLTNHPRVRWNFLNAGGTSRNFIRRAGLEDVKLINTNPGYVWNVNFGFAEECWMHNVHSEDGSTAHVWMFDSYRCEIRKCRFSGIIGPITSSRGYGIQLGTPNGGLPPDKTTALLFVDNIIEKTRGGIILGYGASGCVVAYNHIVKMVSDAIYPDPSTHQKPAISFHSSFPNMNLAEGNVTDGLGVAADQFHGNGHWNTVVRNWFKGKAPGKTGGLVGVELDYQHREYNVFGNVFGYAGIMEDIAALGGTARKRAVALVDAHSYNNDFAGLMLGYRGIGGETTNADPKVAESLAAHGNFDYVTPAGQSWETTNANVVDPSDHTIEDSFFLAAKPDWFGLCKFPPIDPAAPPVADDIIPASYRYIHGVDPTDGAPLPTPTPEPEPTPEPDPDPLPVPPVGEAPVIVSSFSNMQIRKRATVSLDVAATGPDLKYRWQKGTSLLAGQTGPTYTISNANPGDAATYTCTVSNPFGVKTASGRIAVLK